MPEPEIAFPAQRIVEVVAEMESAPSITRAACYWDHLNALNLRRLEGRGFAEFKRTINGHQDYPNLPRLASGLRPSPPHPDTLLRVRPKRHGPPDAGPPAP